MSKSIPCTASTLACILSLQSTGCSFLFSDGPPPKKDRYREFDCSGYALPVVDTVLTGWYGLNAFAAARTSQADWDAKKSPISRSTVMTVGLLELGIYGASAVYGYYNAKSCNEAKAEAAARKTPRAPGAPPALSSWASPDASSAEHTPGPPNAHPDAISPAEPGAPDAGADAQ